jgi:3-hydroxyisobutyrate dehydrogenase-like beta-hydroxyacid dehydrogenase
LNQVGFLGLGAIGTPIAERIRTRTPLLIHDVDEAAAAQFGGTDTRASTAAELASRVDILFNCLPSERAHRDALLGPNGVIHGDRVRHVINVGTTGPFLAREISEGLAARGIETLGAAVSGGPHLARSGTLTTIASGALATFEQVRPLIETYSRKIYFVGTEIEQAQTMKLVNNILSAANLAIASEALTVGARAGLDPALMLEILNEGTGQNSATSTKILRHVLPGTFDYGGRLQLVCKDLEEYLATARSLSGTTRLSELVVSIFREAAASEGADSDMTTVVRPLERKAGVELRAKAPLS